jgi:hypothetical protein
MARAVRLGDPEASSEPLEEPAKRAATNGRARKQARPGSAADRPASPPAPVVDHPPPKLVPSRPRRPLPDAYELLRSEVLAAIQSRRVDTAAVGDVEGVVRDLVDNYQARARTGLGGHPLANPATMVEWLCRSVLDFGPLTPFVTGGAPVRARLEQAQAGEGGVEARSPS